MRSAEASAADLIEAAQQARSSVVEFINAKLPSGSPGRSRPTSSRSSTRIANPHNLATYRKAPADQISTEHRVDSAGDGANARRRDDRTGALGGMS
jgi:hypothetical protein